MLHEGGAGSLAHIATRQNGARRGKAIILTVEKLFPFKLIARGDLVLVNRAQSNSGIDHIAGPAGVGNAGGDGLKASAGGPRGENAIGAEVLVTRLQSNSRPNLLSPKRGGAKAGRAPIVRVIATWNVSGVAVTYWPAGIEI